MLKNFILIIICAISLFACEKDDICVDDTTPNLIIRFYNNSNDIELKKVENLEVINNEDNVPIMNTTITASTDSIAIPLSVINDKTSYVLTTSNNSDTINIAYTRADDFVSRSCGYKTLYNNVVVSVISDNDNWIKKISTVNSPQTIENEKKAHVKIWH